MFRLLALSAAALLLAAPVSFADDEKKVEEKKADEKKPDTKASKIDKTKLFGTMDADGDGSVSLDEMATALKPKGGGPHQAHRAGGGADALMEALQGASSTSTTNSDGSITTTLTYADGSKVTISQPASSTTSTGASTQYNLVERLVQRQTDALASSARQSVSVKV